MNKIILIGRLTKDSETRLTQTGKKIANFSLAVSEGKDKAQFFNCMAWEKLADIVEKYTAKGSQVAIVGRLQNRSWDKPDGTKGYATDIVVNELELLGKANKEADEWDQVAKNFDEPPSTDIVMADIEANLPF